ncbi:MAG: hypothetical protein MZV63_40700 [Marinilabiliales bacterium]|nr:hypothetical protein [Marinilabiliales bacterium]
MQRLLIMNWKNQKVIIVEQLIRPTGLLDPEVEVRPSLNQIDDLMEEINIRTEKNQRILDYNINQKNGRGVNKIFSTI